MAIKKTRGRPRKVAPPQNDAPEGGAQVDEVKTTSAAEDRVREALEPYAGAMITGEAFKRLVATVCDLVGD